MYTKIKYLYRLATDNNFDVGKFLNKHVFETANIESVELHRASNELYLHFDVTLVKSKGSIEVYVPTLELLWDYEFNLAVGTVLVLKSLPMVMTTQEKINRLYKILTDERNEY